MISLFIKFQDSGCILLNKDSDVSVRFVYYLQIKVGKQRQLVKGMFLEQLESKWPNMVKLANQGVLV